MEQVADLLGLHVKTVRGFVHDGRLKAVRIGKQYRISGEGVEISSGGAVPSIVQVEAVSPAWRTG